MKRRQDVLLIEPSTPQQQGVFRTLGSLGSHKAEVKYPPLDLMIIDGLLIKNNIQSQIIDANSKRLSIEHIKKIIELNKPKLVVINTSTTTISNDLKIADISKSISKEIITAAIGTHVMAIPNRVLNECPNLDIAVYSEPEMVILNLIKNNFDFENILGIVYRSNGKVVKNNFQPLIENLDQFGFPSHNKLDYSIYQDPSLKFRPLTLTYGSRGCINKCIYCPCPIYGKIRFRTVPHLIKELKWIKELGIKEVKFHDACITSNKEWINEFLDAIIKEKINLSWSCSVRSDALPLDIFLKMKQAGCHMVYIGCETANNSIMKTIKKNITIEQVVGAVKNAKKAKMNTLVHFQIGLPGESFDTIKQTLNFAKKINPDFVTFGITTPHPGTEFWNYLEDNNLFNTRDWNKFDPILRPVFDYSNISSEQMYSEMLKAYRSFYLRPSYIINRIFNLRTFEDVKINLINFIGFVKRFIF